MNNVIVTKENFKQTRESYGIALKDVADKVHVSIGTVSNFENSKDKYTDTCTRGYNAANMLMALQELIDIKLANLFVTGNSNEKEEPKVEEKKARYKSIPRKNVYDVVLDYCLSNKLNTREFCKMCGISFSTLINYERHPFMTLQTVNKICTATGWKPDIFDNPEESIKKMKEKEATKIEDKTEEKPFERSKKKHNYKLYMEDGKFYEEFDYYVKKHTKNEITKEQFKVAIDDGENRIFTEFPKE